MAEFFAMGGYAVYIWPAYGVAAGVIVGPVCLVAGAGCEAAPKAEALGRVSAGRAPRQ